MPQSFKKGVKISAGLGILAGILLLPVLNNFKVELGLARILMAVAGMTILTLGGFSFAFWLSARWPVILQFMKFGIVGGFNTLLDLGILNLLIFITGIASGVFYSIFKATSFLIAVNSSYFLNKYWTFEVTGSSSAKEVTKYLLVYLVGFGLNVGIASLMVNVVGAPTGVSEKIWANIGAVSSSVIGMFWNFLGTKWIVFKK